VLVVFKGSRAAYGNQDRHILTWNGAIGRCTRQVISDIVDIASDTRNGCCKSPLWGSEQQLWYTVTCYFTIRAKVVPEFLSFELNEIACTPFIVAQHHTSMDHSIFPVVCRYDVSDSDRCWHVIWKAETRSKADIALQHPDGVTIFVPLVKLRGNESLRKPTRLIRNATSNRGPLPSSEHRAWRYSKFRHIFSKLASIVPSKAEREGEICASNSI
jgi:hypothetical protein